jgi:hypothetical protein
MTLRERIAQWLIGDQFAQGAPHGGANMITDSYWNSFGRQHDRDQANISSQYADALTAWRKNPLAWRIIQITTDYTVGEGIKLSSPDPDLQRFIESFWEHRENNIALRLESMAEELARAGDLFPLLFRERHTGVSLLRFITKDEIQKIETKPNDWEKELYIWQKTDDPTNPKKWVTAHHGRNSRYKAIAMHYNINKPIGAMFGESDLATVLPWLQRYSRMLEDRVRFHWATRLFLWIVKVPRNRVQEKAEQYRRPPDAGSIIVHDESEEWEVKSPVIRGSDAAPDLKAVRNMLDAGSGYPPHWRGEATDVNLATAQAMQEPAERHLARRQNYFTWMLQDITWHAYQRANQLRPQLWPDISEERYDELFTVSSPDVSRTDNFILSQATNQLAAAFQSINDQYPGSDTLRKILLKLLMKFAGEQQDDDILEEIMGEAGDAIRPQAPPNPGSEETPPKAEEPQTQEKVKQNGTTAF